MPNLTGLQQQAERTPTADVIMTRADGQLSSFNAEARTVDLVLATETAVRRLSWDEGIYDEILVVSPQSIDVSRLGSMALLDQHDTYSGIDSRLGSIVPGSLRFEGKTAIVTAKISRNDKGVALFRDLEDGHVLGASVGYRITSQIKTEAPVGGTAVIRATRWLPMEISIASVPADPNASTRSNKGNPMPEAILETVTAPVVAPIVAPAVATRAAVNAQIRTIAKTAGLDAAWVDEQVDSERSIDEVNAAALAAMTARSAAANVRSVHNETSLDNPAVRVRAAGEALFARSNPRATLSEQARQFAGMSTVDHARAALVNAGQSVSGLSPANIIERALHTTSDFPLLLGDSVGRSLRQAYEATPSGLKKIGRQTTARDFKDKHRLQLSEAPRLEKVNEAGEFKAGTFSEEKQSYRLATYGKIFNISRQALINDDLGAFNDLSRRMGQAAAATEAQLLADMFQLNSGKGPTMNDGKAMFHLDHKNLGTAQAFGSDPLGKARTAMRKQVGISGELITVDPKYLIVPAELETQAEQLLSTTYYPNGPSGTITDSMKRLEIVVEPRLSSATGFYLAADPSTIDGLEFAYLEGEEGVVVETKSGWEVDGVSIKARLDFGASFLDYRSFYLNQGV